MELKSEIGALRDWLKQDETRMRGSGEAGRPGDINAFNQFENQPQWGNSPTQGQPFSNWTSFLN